MSVYKYDVFYIIFIYIKSKIRNLFCLFKTYRTQIRRIQNRKKSIMHAVNNMLFYESSIKNLI